MEERLRTLVNGALAVVAVGTCAAYGGIPAAWPNPTAVRGVGDFLRADHLKAPVINVPGCPPHPRWFVETLAHLFLYGLPSPEDLDPVGRLKVVYPSLVHEQCPRRADFDVGRFAKSSGESGCLYELGCRGPYTEAHCPTTPGTAGSTGVSRLVTPVLAVASRNSPISPRPFSARQVSRRPPVPLGGPIEGHCH